MIGAKIQVGVGEYLIVGKMNLDNNTYSVIQLPFDLEGIIFYSLIAENGEMYSKVVVATNQDVEPIKSEFVVVPMTQAKVIPNNVRFIPN